MPQNCHATSAKIFKTEPQNFVKNFLIKNLFPKKGKKNYKSFQRASERQVQDQARQTMRHHPRMVQNFLFSKIVFFVRYRDFVPSTDHLPSEYHLHTIFFTNTIPVGYRNFSFSKIKILCLTRITQKIFEFILSDLNRE